MEEEILQIKEYLRIKKIEEEDKSDELIDGIYNEITKKNLNGR